MLKIVKSSTFFKNVKTPLVALAVSQQRLTETKYPGDNHLIHCFAKHNITVTKVVWDDPKVKWEKYDLVILHQTWAPKYEESYYHRKAEYFAWLSKLETMDVPVVNSKAIVEKFFNKGRYLVKLAQLGVTIIPTIILEKGKHHNIGDIMRQQQWHEAVIKVSEGDSGAHIYRIIPESEQSTDKQELFQQVCTADKSKSVIYTAGEFQNIFSEISKQQDFIIQKFMPEIKETGEISCVIINGQFSHAIRKMTKPNSEEFRTQRMYSDQIPILTALNHVEKEKIMSIYQHACKDLDEFNQPIAMRIDVIMKDQNAFLMEIEAIDPWLYIDHIIQNEQEAELICSQYIAGVKHILQQPVNRAVEDVYQNVCD